MTTVHRRNIKKLIRGAIPGSGGIKTLIAKRAGISRTTLDQYLSKHADLEKLFEEESESALDAAESQLLRAIQRENLTAIIFFLKTKGKKRGYIERSEIDLTDVSIKIPNSLAGLD